MELFVIIRNQTCEQLAGKLGELFWDRDVFLCSVRFSLLSTDEQVARHRPPGALFQPKTQVQLSSRHWNIRNREGELIEEVDGDGVIGEYPILQPGKCPGCWLLEKPSTGTLFQGEEFIELGGIDAHCKVSLKALPGAD